MQTDIEARLKALSPVAGRIDPIAAAFAAGKKSAAVRWRAITAMLVVAAVMPWCLPKTKSIPTAPTAEVAIAPVHIDPPPPENVWQLREAVLEKGLDGLPQAPVANVRTMRAMDAL